MMNKPKLFGEICKLFLQKVNEKLKPWTLTNPNMIFAVYRHGFSVIFHTFCFNSGKVDDIVKVIEDVILYYIEYVLQSKEEKNVFLKLTPFDASHFLFRKHLLFSGSNDDELDKLLFLYINCLRFIKESSNNPQQLESWWEKRADEFNEYV